jgi:hypothetical protein
MNNNVIGDHCPKSNDVRLLKKLNEFVTNTNAIFPSIAINQNENRNVGDKVYLNQMNRVLFFLDSTVRSHPYATPNTSRSSNSSMINTSQLSDGNLPLTSSPCSLSSDPSFLSSAQIYSTSMNDSQLSNAQEHGLSSLDYSKVSLAHVQHCETHHDASGMLNTVSASFIGKLNKINVNPFLRHNASLQITIIHVIHLCSIINRPATFLCLMTHRISLIRQMLIHLMNIEEYSSNLNFVHICIVCFECHTRINH